MHWLATSLALLFMVLFFLYKYSTRKFDYWKKRGVSYIEPVPFIGNIGPVFRMKTTLSEWLWDLYEKLPGKYFGIFILDEPHLVLKDPILIKHVLQKDFNYFENRTVHAPKNNPIFSKWMFFLHNPTWKSVRSKLTPVFTSSKLKLMFPLIMGEGAEMVEYLDGVADQGTIEAKEVCAKYSTNVIAKCAFAVDAQSYRRQDSEFREIGRKIFDFRYSNAFRQFSNWVLPGLVNLFDITVIEKPVADRLHTIFTDVLTERRKSTNRSGLDLIDMLLEIENEDNTEKMDENTRMAQAVQFFAAGFETTSSIISVILYEMALHKDYQDKLRQLMTESIQKHGCLCYEAANDMEYLDMCVREGLRKYGVLPFLDRRCNANYKMPGTDFVVEKGMSVLISILGLHYDPKYFPDPHRYDPERFRDMSKINRDGFYYLPFGEGPRTCIGERFGMLTVKIGLISILTQFNVERTDQTPDKLTFEPKSMILQSKIGIPVRFVPIKKNN